VVTRCSGVVIQNLFELLFVVIIKRRFHDRRAHNIDIITLLKFPILQSHIIIWINFYILLISLNVGLTLIDQLQFKINHHIFVFLVNLINFSLIIWYSSLRNKIILRRVILRGIRRMNHGEFCLFIHWNALCFYFCHCVLHGVITSMINIKNITVLLNHSILFVEIRLFRPSISHVVMILRFGVNLFKMLVSSLNFGNIRFRGALPEWCRTIDMILHFLMIIELLLHHHTFMSLYLRSRIRVR